MIKCFIIEDEPLAQNVLKKYIKDHPYLELIGVSANPMDALDTLNYDEVDLLFLDINLPKISGINFYKSLHKKPKVVFTTAYSEFALDGFELSAIDYLVKPFSFERFLMAIEKVRLVNKTTNSDFLIIKNDKKTFRLPFQQIKYIESIGDYVKVHTEGQVLLSNDTLKNLVDLLPDSDFVRVHKSYIVSLQKIKYLEGNRLKIGEKMIPIGYAYRQNIGNIFKK